MTATDLCPKCNKIIGSFKGWKGPECQCDRPVGHGTRGAHSVSAMPKGEGELLMEFPERITGIENADGRIWIKLESGQMVDCTDLLGDAKQ